MLVSIYFNPTELLLVILQSVSTPRELGMELVGFLFSPNNGLGRFQSFYWKSNGAFHEGSLRGECLNCGDWGFNVSGKE